MLRSVRVFQKVLEKFSGNFFVKKETRRILRREFLLFNQFLAPNFAGAPGTSLPI